MGERNTLAINAEQEKRKAIKKKKNVIDIEKILRFDQHFLRLG